MRSLACCVLVELSLFTWLVLFLQVVRRCVRKEANIKTTVLVLEVMMANQVNALCPAKAPNRSSVSTANIRLAWFQNHEHGTTFIEDNFKESLKLRLVWLVGHVWWHRSKHESIAWRLRNLQLLQTLAVLPIPEAHIGWTLRVLRLVPIEVNRD